MSAKPSWLDDFFGKMVAIAGVDLPTRPRINIVSGATAQDNPTTKSTDLTIGGGIDLARTSEAWIRFGWRDSESVNFAHGDGNFTVGARFRMLQPSTIYGVRFIYGVQPALSYGNRTLKATIWKDSDGTVLTTASVLLAETDRGLHFLALASPLAIGEALVNVDLTIGIYDTSGLSYAFKTGSDFIADAIASKGPIRFPGIQLRTFALRSVGDARPTTLLASTGGWVEPAFTIP